MTNPVSDSLTAEATTSRHMPPERELFELVYRQMRSLVGMAERDFDDLVQDAMEQVLLAKDRFEGRSKVSTWTYQIAYRTVLRRRRGYGRWLRRFSFTRDGELPDVAPQTDALGQHAVGQAQHSRQRAQRLWAALERLSPKKRVVVVLHDLEGLPCEEIAEVIEQKLGTVRSRLRDGRKDLLSQLERDPFFGVEGEQT